VHHVGIGLASQRCLHVRNRGLSVESGIHLVAIALLVQGCGNGLLVRLYNRTKTKSASDANRREV
jgi:hypothetical protein